MVAVYTNDFTGVSGAPPSDFTLSESTGTGGTIDISGGNSLRLLTTATNFNCQRIILPSSSASFADGEVLVTYLPVTGLGQMNVILRGSGSWAAGDTPTNGYILFLNMAGAYFELYRINSGAGTLVGVSQPFVWSTGSWYFTRFAVGGAVLKAKVWLGSSPEPAAWTYEVTDGTPYTTAGQFHLTFRTVSSAVRDMRLDNVGLFTPQAHASTATSTGIASNATATVTGASASASAQVAVSVGAAMFDGDDSDSINLEIYAPVPGGGQAYNATVTTVNNTNVAAQSLTKTGTANNPSVTRTGTAEPTAATASGAAQAPTVTTSTGTITASAAVALGSGDATGISYLLDENGDPILDELGQTIEDGYGLTLTVSPTSGAAVSAGAGVAPSRSVAPLVGVAVASGAALQPSISVDGATNVNAAVAIGASAANSATTFVSPSSGVSTSAGAANAPQVDIPVQAGVAESVGRAYDWEPVTAQPAAVSVGAAYDAQINVDGSNFISAAAIPVAATAPDPSVGISVYPDAITVTGEVPPAGPNIRDEPGQLITVRDHGHTVSLKER